MVFRSHDGLLGADVAINYFDDQDAAQAVAGEVEQAAGAGNDDLDAPPQGGHLRRFAHPAVDGRAAHLCMAAQVDARLVDLFGQGDRQHGFQMAMVVLATLALTGAGWWAVRTTPLDAIPDLSDVQVIIQTDYAGQAPQLVEDQVTYPIASEMLKVPGAGTVRGYSFFGDSYVYVIFDDPALSGAISLDRVANGQADAVHGVVYLGSAAGDLLGYAVAFTGPRRIASRVASTSRSTICENLSWEKMFSKR